AAFNDGLSENLKDFHELFNQMSTVTNEFKTGTNRLNKNFSSLFSYFENMDRKNERIAKSFELTNDKIKETSDAQINSLQTFDTDITNMKEITESQLENQKEAGQELENIHEKTKGLVDTIGAQTIVMKDIFGDDLSAKLGNISIYLTNLQNGVDYVGELIGIFQEAVIVVYKTYTEKILNLRSYHR